MQNWWRLKRNGVDAPGASITLFRNVIFYFSFIMIFWFFLLLIPFLSTRFTSTFICYPFFYSKRCPRYARRTFIFSLQKRSVWLFFVYLKKTILVRHGGCVGFGDNNSWSPARDCRRDRRTAAVVFGNYLDNPKDDLQERVSSKGMHNFE